MNADLSVKILNVVSLYVGHVDRNLFTLSLCLMNNKLIFHRYINQIHINFFNKGVDFYNHARKSWVTCSVSWLTSKHMLYIYDPLWYGSQCLLFEVGFFISTYKGSQFLS